MFFYDDHMYCESCGGHDPTCWCKDHKDFSDQCVVGTALHDAEAGEIVQVQL